jgi:hypothetical protein
VIINNKMSQSKDSNQNVNVEEVMRNIEAKTEKLVITAIKTNKIEDPINLISGQTPKNNMNQSIDILKQIMESGNSEFKEKVGRPMTYSEMRSMFG